ncbi:Oidioi.mRNA.OKI2018_I69.XSR.g13831.t1.cds [Oikopleura dioica]|uniref:Oidioi.mRNA.OKI2018_I69.XSR.g13831.t1.cds n=1 Tax=Oikopleura dioica TaxID=34765 RepID=A0ABN7SBU0_OIKDI|nr:Oidioi.mRNA.OKI2018_I69.XSR.g13831.t1.cds [Oikopleura dioica]
MRVRQLSSKSNGSSKSSANETLTKTPENKLQRAGSAKCPNSARRLERKSLMESFGQASSPAFQLNKGFMKKPITKKALKRPLTISPSKLVQKEFNECFKSVNNYLKSENNDDLKKLVVYGWNQSDLANEIYAIIIKQSRGNPEVKESLQRGLELVAILLFFTAPSLTLSDVILEWLDEVAATAANAIGETQLEKICRSHLEKILTKGNRRGLVEPSMSEILQAKRHLYHESMFGISLQKLLVIQKEKFPELEIPWIQKELTKEIIRLGGFTTEGIFRLPGEIDKVHALKTQVEDYEIVDTSSVDCHVACSLLKLWFRELSEPIFPLSITEEILDCSEDMESSIAIVAKLPAENQATLLHLIRFLQTFTKPEIALKTRMDSSNLAMVMAPNLFRPVSDDPRALLDNSRREINLLRNLIEGLDTKDAAGYDSDFQIDIV